MGLAIEIIRAIEGAQGRQQIQASQIVSQIHGSQVAPGTVVPAAHTQAASTITDLTEAVQDIVAALLKAGTAITLSYDDAAGELTISSAYPALSGLATGAVLRATGATSAAFGAVDLADSDARTGILPVANGGNGVSSIISASAAAAADQTIATGTFTKLAFATEVSDPGSCYDPTNSRFTPSVAGTYLVTAQTLYYYSADQKLHSLFIYKNGARSYKETGVSSSGTGNLYLSLTMPIAMNGSTDYLEIYAYHNAGGDLTTYYPSTNVSFVWIAP